MQQRRGAGKELVERYEVTQRFSHLLAEEGNHAVGHPVAHRVAAVVSNRLGYLAIGVREPEVHAAAVYVERASEIFLAHGRTLQRPAGESLAPCRRPVPYMLRCGLNPQREVGGIALLLRPVECAGRGKKLVDMAARQASVAEIGRNMGTARPAESTTGRE